MSAETKTKAEAPRVAPPAQPIATVKRKEAWETFHDQILERADELATQLPPNLPRDRFIGAALAAVKSNPEILLATPRSLMSALTKAAQDGLLPDGREGIITTYKTTVKEAGKAGRTEIIAQWNPMFYGIRKRAREIDGIIIDAQVVFAGDDFEYELGDEPFIKHKPKPRTEAVDASGGVAVYAIFRAADKSILHREVMWKPEVFATMNQSRAKGSLMWTTFWTEGWRKTVGRRAAKSVPVSPQLERLIQRDDENFVFDRPPPTPQIKNDLPDIDLPGDEPDPTIPADQNGTGGEPGAATSGADVLTNAVLTNSTIRDGAKNEHDQSGSTDAEDNQDGPAFAPTGEITSEVANFLAELRIELAEADQESEIEERFDGADVQTRLAGNQLAIAKAFQIKTNAINKLATDQRAELEGAGQGDIFGGQLPEVPGDEKPFPGDVPMTKAQKIAGTP